MKELIEKYLKTPGLDVRYFGSIDSTNTALRALAESGAPEGTVLTANMQTAGRGRRGRDFYSPKGTGLYMSLLLRPRISPEKSLYITSAAAVATAQTLEKISGEAAGIKWVNDIYMREKKVCGILTEASLTASEVRYAIVGIGVNLLPPDGGFPPELAETAGSAYLTGDADELFSRTAAGIADGFMALYRELETKSFLSEYRRRSVLTGADVDVYRMIGGTPERAQVLGIDDDFGLILRHADGRTESVSSGEVSIRKAPISENARP